MDFIQKLKRKWQTRNDGTTIPYDELYKITEPTVVCLRAKQSGSFDRTRVIFPNGDCFYSWQHFIPNLEDMKGKHSFSWSCFQPSKQFRDLKGTIDNMKLHDGDQFEIKKIYPYKGTSK